VTPHRPPPPKGCALHPNRAALRYAIVSSLAGLGLYAAAQAQPVALSGGLSENTSQPLRIHRLGPGLKPGMVVLDSHGEKVGVITDVNQIRDGRPAVLLQVNGAQIKVRTSKFRIAADRDEAVIALTRSQIRTAAILNTE
jgi:hypothetical protein